MPQQSSSRYTSPRSGKYSNSTYSGGRRPSNQRPQLSQRRDFDDVTYIEKEVSKKWQYFGIGSGASALVKGLGRTGKGSNDILKVY